jgi:hypothetical protein
MGAPTWQEHERAAYAAFPSSAVLPSAVTLFLPPQERNESKNPNTQSRSQAVVSALSTLTENHVSVMITMRTKP